ncbi:MAG: hypothetical protein ACO3A2_02695 [Bdellovibrionia bacterium]
MILVDRKLSFFSFIFLLGLSQAFAANDFEVLYEQKLPELERAYAPVLQKRNELDSLCREVRSAKVRYQFACSDPVLLEPFWAPGRLDDLMNAMSEREQAEGNLQDVQSQYTSVRWDLKKREIFYTRDYLMPLINQYAWAIPNDHAIETISRFGPIVEVGAGSGYWAHLIHQNGVSIEAYDNFFWEEIGAHRPQTLWFPQIKRANVLEVPWDQYAHHTLLLVWPPRGEFSIEALRHFQGSRVIYVGESPQSFVGTPCAPAMGDPAFFHLLNEKFHLVEEVEIPNWPGYSDRLFVYERRQDAIGAQAVASEVQENSVHSEPSSSQEQEETSGWSDDPGQSHNASPLSPSDEFFEPPAYRFKETLGYGVLGVGLVLFVSRFWTQWLGL